MSRSPFSFGYGAPAPWGAQRQVAPGMLAGFFNAVYAWMAAGLGVTALIAWWVSTQPELMARIFGGPMWLVLVIAELALVFSVASAVRRINATAATALFLLYAGLNGLTLSVVFVAFAHATVAAAFIVAAATFGAMSLYGMVTRRDLSQLGSVLMMGLIGIVIASFVSLFWHNSLLSVALNYIGVLVFVGLTAYDTQRLKALAYGLAGDAQLSARFAITGALMLYLDFINLFLFLLQIFAGNERER